MAESKTERDERIKAEKEFRVRFHVRETGITEEQARELIDLSAGKAAHNVHLPRLVTG
ncbi:MULTISPECIES: hypothetical protein [unclassified Mesorhizobium]|uniref:hypothetical protein n=1 Tax=unclassified Mesorhizobium TaxID=325217 RepID=UPI0013E06FDF|nr:MULTISPECIES: hypothetical protein [unclassified Mesorhizobium]